MIGSILKLLNGFSYKEKSILISLIAVTSIYGGYFFDVMNGAADRSLATMLQSMFGIVVALVLSEIVYYGAQLLFYRVGIHGS